MLRSGENDETKPTERGRCTTTKKKSDAAAYSGYTEVSYNKKMKMVNRVRGFG
jgi:hypothetical protein